MEPKLTAQGQAEGASIWQHWAKQKWSEACSGPWTTYQVHGTKRLSTTGAWQELATFCLCPLELVTRSSGVGCKSPPPGELKLLLLCSPEISGPFAMWVRAAGSIREEGTAEGMGGMVQLPVLPLAESALFQLDPTSLWARFIPQLSVSGVGYTPALGQVLVHS